MKSLTNFPEDFDPIIVVTGDRRENPPRCKGDLLAYSLSTIDLLYINYLNLKHAMVYSDKVFAMENDDYLSQKFGKTNILVIGSPAVNLLSRRINDRCAFRFSIADETRILLSDQNEFIEKYCRDEDEDAFFIYQQCLEGITEIEKVLNRFVGLEPNFEELRRKAEHLVPEFLKTKLSTQSNRPISTRPIRFLMNKLSRPGIYDSLSGCTRGESIPAYKDYGLVSMIRNPFSLDETDNDYWIIYVGGVHGPATAHGLKLFSEKDAFVAHPYGGVFEVLIHRYAGYFERIQRSRARWETPGYESKSMAPHELGINNSLKSFLSSPSNRNDTKQKSFNQKFCSLLSAVCEEQGTHLNIREPYTFSFSNNLDFWQAILDYEKECDFVVHDITTCAKGVMVEIGFSLGCKRPHFLFVNQQKTDGTPVDLLRSPALLPAENIEVIDLSDIVLTKEILRNDIIGKVKNLRGRESNAIHPSCKDCIDLPRTGTKKYAYCYCSEPRLAEYLDKCIRERKIDVFTEPMANRFDKKICRICQSLKVADVVFVEISEDNIDSYLVLGMSKAIGKRVLPISIDKYTKDSFPWAVDVIGYNLKHLESQLANPIAEHLSF